MFHCLCSFHTQHSGHIVNIVWLQNVWAKYTHLHCNGNSGYLAGGSNHTFHFTSPSQASSSASASLSLNYPNCLFIREYLLIMQFGASRLLTIIFLNGPNFYSHGNSNLRIFIGVFQWTRSIKFLAWQSRTNWGPSGGVKYLEEGYTDPRSGVHTWSRLVIVLELETHLREVWSYKIIKRASPS